MTNPTYSPMRVALKLEVHNIKLNQTETIKALTLFGSKVLKRIESHLCKQQQQPKKLRIELVFQL